MWIGSLMPLSALIGGIAGGPLIEYIGRKKTILVTAFPFIGGKIQDQSMHNARKPLCNKIQYIETYTRCNEQAHSQASAP